MHDIDQLEKRWRRYKLKRYALPVGLSVMFIFVAGAVLGVVVSAGDPDTDTTSQKSVAKQSRPAPKTQQETAREKPAKKKQDTQPVLKKEPRVPAAQPAEKKPGKKIVKLQAYEPKLSTLSNPPEPAEEKNSPQQPKAKKEPAHAEPKAKEPSKQRPKNEKKHLQFQSSSQNGFDPTVIEKRYKSEPSVGDAKLLAAYYYDHGQYKAASKWSYRLNQLDSTQEEGWLIFAKSLYKRGKKDDAINVLQGYVSSVASKKANRLLQDMISGEFQ